MIVQLVLKFFLFIFYSITDNRLQNHSSTKDRMASAAHNQDGGPVVLYLHGLESGPNGTKVRGKTTTECGFFFFFLRVFFFCLLLIDATASRQSATRSVMREQGLDVVAVDQQMSKFKLSKQNSVRWPLLSMGVCSCADR